MIAPSRTAGMVMYKRRSRSLWGNVTSVLVQPVAFYEAFPATRQWMWVAAIILAVTGFSAIHQPSAVTSDAGAVVVQEAPPPEMSSDGGPGGVFIPPNDVSGGAPAAAAPDVSKTVMMALLAAGGVLLAWFIQALVLSEVSMISGARPRFGINLQISVWASVPLGLMLVIQQVYFAIGGKAGMMGVSLLLDKWPGFATLPAFSRSALTVLALNFTLFSLWNLVLLYLGGRHVLKGKRAAVLLVILIWVIIVTFVPALTTPDGVKVPHPANTADTSASLQAMSDVNMGEAGKSGGDTSGGMSISPRVIISGGG